MQFELGMTTKTSPPEHKLVDAVLHRDHEAVLKLLSDAGGACQTRQLVKQAELDSSRYGIVNHSLAIDGDKETITVVRSSSKDHLPLVSLTQKKCEK